MSNEIEQAFEEWFEDKCKITTYEGDVWRAGVQWERERNIPPIKDMPTYLTIAEVEKLQAQLAEAEKVIKNLALDMSETMPIIRNETVDGAKAYLEKYKGGGGE